MYNYNFYIFFILTEISLLKFIYYKQKMYFFNFIIYISLDFNIRLIYKN